jgi:hypothetical protein
MVSTQERGSGVDTCSAKISHRPPGASLLAKALQPGTRRTGNRHPEDLATADHAAPLPHRATAAIAAFKSSASCRNENEKRSL